MWRAAIPAEQTLREAEFLIERLELQPGMAALDVPCGNGRHAVELARRGIRMTGVDLSEGFIAEARSRSADIEWVRSDMRQLPWSSRFDAAYCWGNSFAYFDHESCLRFLEAVAWALKPGGRFILESGAVAESLLPVLQPERKLRLGDLDYFSRNSYQAAESRMDITYTFSKDGRSETKPIHQWVHTAAEVGRMLRRCGLEPIETFGGLDGSPYALRSPHFIALTRRD